MKYALLVHQPQEYFDRRDDKAAIAAGSTRTSTSPAVLQPMYLAELVSKI
jgi:hypothetical protein